MPHAAAAEQRRSISVKGFGGWFVLLLLGDGLTSIEVFDFCISLELVSSVGIFDFRGLGLLAKGLLHLHTVQRLIVTAAGGGRTGSVWLPALCYPRIAHMWGAARVLCSRDGMKKSKHRGSNAPPHIAGL